MKRRADEIRHFRISCYRTRNMADWHPPYGTHRDIEWRRGGFASRRADEIRHFLNIVLLHAKDGGLASALRSEANRRADEIRILEDRVAACDIGIPNIAHAS